ncbi:MAG: hypothetical protein AAGJ68_04760 [Pseudomonadota bacterium]
MIGWFSDIRARFVWIFGAVALVHTVVFAVFLSFRVYPTPSLDRDFVEIEFADLEPDPIEVMPPEIIPESHSVSETETSAPQNVIEPMVSLPTRPENSEVAPPILMQEVPSVDETVVAETPSDADASQGPPSISEAELATVVQSLSCQRLAHRRDEACPKLDPFDVAAASQARREAAPAPAQLVGDFGPKTYLENFLSQEDRDPYLMPGMSGDLFTSTLPSGAYNAQRIRNGQTPLWDKETEAGFTRKD